MHRFLRGLLFASAAPFLAITPAILTPVPANAQPADISFDAFHDQLNNYGDWLYSDRWGEVWRPWQQDQDSSWRPYSVGHWVYTDEYGWTWISGEGPWGDIAYHYGRWVFDPDDGWLWLTGYVWSPAWVVWRSAGPNVGWMPMPPDDAFLGNSAPVNVSFGDWGDTGNFYGYARWYGPQFDENRFGALWTFVPAVHVADPVYRNYAVPQPQIVNIVRISRNVTNYTVVNNVIINKSININIVQGAGGKPVTPVHANAVLHTTRWIAPVTRGQQVQAQMRDVHPRGNGTVNSAPKPTPQQIRTLSPQPRGRAVAAGGGQHHLFSQANVTQIKTTRPAPNAPANAPAAPHPAAAAPQRPPQQPSAMSRPSREPVTPGAHEAPRPMHEPVHPTPPATERPSPGAATRENHPVPEQRANPTPPPRPVETRPPGFGQTMRAPPRHAPLPRPAAQPRPTPHPQAEHAGGKPEHHDEDRKPEH
jgi:hypothetical protein